MKKYFGNFVKKNKLLKSFTLKLNNLLSMSRKATIISHHNPDGDALGSSLALYNFLIEKKIKPTIVLPNPFPEFLDWMHTDEELIIYSKKNSLKIKEILNQSDIVFCIDLNALNRTNKLETYIRNSSAKKVLIDHHPDPEIESFDIHYSKIDTSSTAELIFDVINGIDGDNVINKKIAESIYVGMITDTGSFSYSCNYVSTFLIVAKLVGLGVDCANIQRLVYNNFSENRMRLFGICLSKNLYVFPEFKTAYIVLSLKDLEKYSFKVGDTEGIVNYAMAIKGIEFAALFVERQDLIRISLRSYGNLSVNQIAKTFFDGGGHKNAAGANSYYSLRKTVNIFKNILPQLKEYYQN